MPLPPREPPGPFLDYLAAHPEAMRFTTAQVRTMAQHVNHPTWMQAAYADTAQRLDALTRQVRVLRWLLVAQLALTVVLSMLVLLSG